jgi:hypothetical protein
MPAVDPPLPAVTAAPLDWATGTLTLADPAIALRPAAPSCTTSPFTKATLDSVLSGAPVNNQAALGLAGKMAIDKLPAPTTDEPQPVEQPPVEPQPTFVASQGPSLAGPATITFPKSSKQRGLKSGGAVMTLTADRASDLVITPTVSIPGAGKTKLKALRRTVAAGKSTIAIKFPAALRKKALKALKARKTITVTTSTVATAVGSAAPVTITNTIKLSR